MGTLEPVQWLHQAGAREMLGWMEEAWYRAGTRCRRLSVEMGKELAFILLVRFRRQSDLPWN